ncbi:MAG: tryptophan synthase subunit alpha [Bacteroidota bacterium]
MSVSNLFKENKKDILNIFYTAGYPKLDNTVTIAQSLDKAGVKLIELGMPYSDPLADGTTIQLSSEIALKNGMNLDILFSQASEIHDKTDLTVVLMGYLNQLLTIGVPEFLEKCVAAGVSGLIIPDLPMEIYEEQYKSLFEEKGIEISFLITPRTSDARIRLADKLSTGFIYLVADNSITGGASGKFTDAQIAYFERIKNMDLESPVLIGFGIKTAEQFQQTKSFANGAIIGSEFIRQLDSVENDLYNQISCFINEITV